MIEPTEHRMAPTGRAALRVLLFLGATGLFLLLSPLAARADDGSSGLGGLVETVTGTVDEATGSATGTLEDATDAATGTVEEVLDTAIETVEEVVETATDSAGRVTGDATGAVEPVTDAIDPRIGTAPPPPAGEDPPPVPDPVNAPPAPDRVGHADRRTTADEAPRKPASALRMAGVAAGWDLESASSGPPGLGPLPPRDPAGAPTSTSADSPTNLRFPAQGQDLALIAAALLFALVLVRWSRREGGLRTSLAFLSLLERPG